MRHRKLTLAYLPAALMAASAVALLTAPATAQDDTTGEETPATMSESMRRMALRNPIGTIEGLLRRIQDMERQMAELRIEVADAHLAESKAQRELDELRQFIEDNQRLGNDFEQYQRVRDIAEQEDRERLRQAARSEMDAARAEREARRLAITAERNRQRAEADRLRGYRNAGFSPLGLDVFASRMAFHYDGDVNSPSRLDYEPGFGTYRRYYPPISTTDYTSMTISGSVLNAAETIRNLGVAIVFFDENGNQVGQHIVQVNNARPNIPYPFTAELDMALNRPFDSTSTYVLYSDPAAGDDAEPLETWRSSPESPYARVK